MGYWVLALQVFWEEIGKYAFFSNHQCLLHHQNVSKPSLEILRSYFYFAQWLGNLQILDGNH